MFGGFDLISILIADLKMKTGKAPEFLLFNSPEQLITRCTFAYSVIKPASLEKHPGVKLKIVDSKNVFLIKMPHADFVETDMGSDHTDRL